jgi:hypothetical protein
MELVGASRELSTFSAGGGPLRIVADHTIVSAPTALPPPCPNPSMRASAYHDGLPSLTSAR